MRRSLICVLFLALPPVVGANELDLNVNDDAARLSYAWPVRSETLQVDVAWLYHQDKGDIASAGLHLVDLASGGASPLKAGVGGKVFYMDGDPNNTRGGALGLGGFFRYTFPQSNRIGIGGHVYFAPDVVSVGDTEQYSELAVHVSYNVLREADVYLGVRNAKGEFENGQDVTFDTGLHVGIRLGF